MEVIIVFAQVVFSGLALGSIYGLVALGFAVIFKATTVFNFAQGMLVVCGAFLTVSAATLIHPPFMVSVALAVAIAALFGVAIHALLIRPMAG